MNDICTEFAGHRVAPFTDTLPAGANAVRISVDYDQHEDGVKFSDELIRLRELPIARSLEALVVGDWGSAATGEGCESVIQSLVDSKDFFPNLTALFIGDMTSEMCEVSWIRLADYSPLWRAFPKLKIFRSRGMDGLNVGIISLPHLTHLIIETGGMPVSAIRQLCNSNLPKLQLLELWLGDDGYGWDGTVSDLAPILQGKLFPELQYLGLRNSCIADAIAAVVANAPILDRIKTLDLSLGNLSDDGAKTLAASTRISKLKILDIHHHYVSEEVVNLLKKTGVILDASDKQEEDTYGGETYRYISVSE